MDQFADIIASLDRALADAGACNFATKSGPAQTGKVAVSAGIAARFDASSLVGTPHPTPSPSPSHSSHLPTSPSTPRQSKQLKEAVAATLPILTLPWRKLWAYQKLARAFVAADQAGAISFTLNLSPRLQGTLEQNADPARQMSHYINRELKKATGMSLPYAFTFEVSPIGRLHLHGVIVPTSFTEEHIAAIAVALSKAGGKLRAANIVRVTQSYLGKLYDGIGWFAYLQYAASTPH